jgi:hypothetical protein
MIEVVLGVLNTLDKILKRMLTEPPLILDKKLI